MLAGVHKGAASFRRRPYDFPDNMIPGQGESDLM